MQIISRREHKTIIHFKRFFERKESPGSGFSFDCDEAGNVDVSKLEPIGLESYQDCLKNEGGIFVDRGAEKYERRYIEPAVGLCEDCKRHVSLTGFTNTCECGVDYNMSGQRLASRSQWGEETGESISDIMMADTDRAFDTDY